jgi:chromosome segregation ATPase
MGENDMGKNYGPEDDNIIDTSSNKNQESQYDNNQFQNELNNFDMDILNNKNEIYQEEKKENKQENEIKNEDNQQQEQDNKNQYESKDINGNTINDSDKDLLEKQTIKELNEYNAELKKENEELRKENDKLKEEIETLKKQPSNNVQDDKNYKELTDKIKELEKLENELNEEKKKNEELIEKNNELEEKMKNMQNIPSTENSFSKNESTSLGENREKLLDNILEKDSEIKELKAKLDKAIKLEEGEELISLIFMEESENIHYSVICKNTDKITKPEEKLFVKYPKIKEEDIEFDYFFNKKRIKKSKTLKEYNITNGDIINLKKRE